MIYLPKFVVASAVIAFSLVSFGGCCGAGNCPQPFAQSTCPTCSGGGQTFQGGAGGFASPQFSQGSGTFNAPVQSSGGGLFGFGGSGSR